MLVPHSVRLAVAILRVLRNSRIETGREVAPSEMSFHPAAPSVYRLSNIRRPP
jgi:hypothetical protein